MDATQVGVSETPSISLIGCCCAAFLLLGCPSERMGGAPAAPPVPSDADTSLGPGDVFDVVVFGEKDLSGTYRVDTDGTILFPFVGRVKADGLQPNELAESLARRLEEGGYLRNPQVSVFVKEYNSKRISVVGAVHKPGTFPMTPGMTVVQAISMASGFTPMASRNAVVVTRRERGELKRFRVRVEDITEGRSADFPLRAGDTVYVPERFF